MRRRLLAVVPVDDPGGAEFHLLRLLEGLAARGWDVALTTPGAGRLRGVALGAGWGWHRLPLGGLARGAGARAVASFPTARRLARAVDVVYLNGGVAGRLLPALGARVRRVLHVHDMVGRVPSFWRRADVVLADSEAVARRLNRLRPLPAHVVYGPVDLDPPDVAPPWPPGDGPVIGFVGRIEPRKGPLDLARAAPAIRAGAPGARVVVVGDDPYHSDPAYVDMVDATPGIERFGWVDGAAGLLRHLDVLVLPSHQEPMGTVCAEAMAVGTPVVATRVDGLPEIVRDGETGLLVDPGRPEQIADAVLQVLARREEMGAAAKVWARRFATADYVDRVEALLAA